MSNSNISVTPSQQPCGATVRGIDLRQELAPEQVAELRLLWLRHHVLSFPSQHLGDDDLERFTRYFGSFGDDPFIEPIAGRKHVIAVERSANETAPVFADTFHTDWSFQKHPPAGTCLYGIEIPPKGGDTLFANQHVALESMPPELRARIEGKQAVHSARLAYAPTGVYGDNDRRSGRSMQIVASEEANQTQLHPLITRHPETGAEGIFGCLGYIIGIDGMPQSDAFALLAELHQWQTQEKFIYRHKWEPDMLVMWDNRSVLHAATGGYEGHRRLLHRTTIAAWRDPGSTNL